MNIVDFVKVLAITFISLFPVLNPVGGAPTFLSLTRNRVQFHYGHRIGNRERDYSLREEGRRLIGWLLRACAESVVEGLGKAIAHID
jgi:hypothetical protein